MNIYLVERTDEIGYDQFDAFVCFADSPAVALKLHPGLKSGNSYRFNDEAGCWEIYLRDSWRKDSWPDWTAELYSLKVTYLGSNERGQDPEVIFTSYNAG